MFFLEKIKRAFIEGILDESILSVLQSFTIQSEFFGEDIQLFYFKKSDIQEDGTVNNKLVFMGCKEDINNNLFFNTLQQYIFIQFLKKLKEIQILVKQIMYIYLKKV